MVTTTNVGDALILVAIIAGVFGISGPLLLAWLLNRQRTAERLADAKLRKEEKDEDYDRQDRVAQSAATAARELALSQKVLADQATAAASHLVENNRIVATAAQQTQDGLSQLAEGQKVIHGLVNSSLTTAMNGELGSTMRELVLLQGSPQNKMRDSAIEVAEARIAELTLTISDRNAAAEKVAAEAADVGFTTEDGPPDPADAKA